MIFTGRMSTTAPKNDRDRAGAMVKGVIRILFKSRFKYLIEKYLIPFICAVEQGAVFDYFHVDRAVCTSKLTRNRSRWSEHIIEMI